MSKFKNALMTVGCCFLQFTVIAQPMHYRLIFTGDIMLAREVQHEILEKHNASPWMQLKPFFSSTDWLIGNFEGAVGNSADCKGSPLAPCFAISSSLLPLIREAGFNALGIENNHSSDVDNVTTENALIRNKITPLTSNDSPQFLKLGRYTIAIITFTNIAGRDGKKIAIPSHALLQKLRLAKTLANWVIVYLHWGNELMDWPSEQQREQALWLIRNGADVIIGHHPHVIQKPECILGKPVFFSLGNHVFDQKYPETKKGLIADCRIMNAKLVCHAVQTHTAVGSSFPSIEYLNAYPTLNNCVVAAKQTLSVQRYQISPQIPNHGLSAGKIILQGEKFNEKSWHTSARKLLSLETFQPDVKSKKFLFVLEAHQSDIDNELSPRPYVYSVTSLGLVAKWRGSALAWPLLDGTFIYDHLHNSFLCALHRNDSFLLLNPAAVSTRVAVYRWNGFGFTGVQNSELEQRCRQIFR
jgi:hypothetical protein